MMAKKQAPIFSGRVTLEVGEKLYFKAAELVKIRIEAKCENIEIHRESIEYCWNYTDSCGFGMEFTTKTGIITLNCPNFFVAEQ